MMGQWIKSRPKDFLPSSEPPPCEVPQRGKCRNGLELGGWSSGKLSPTLSEFESQEVDWQPHSGPLAISGKTQGTSLSHMIWQLKILTRNLSLTWGQGKEARDEWSWSMNISACLMSLSWEVLCLESQLHFGVKPWWFTCTTSVEEHSLDSSQLCLLFQKEPLCSAWFSQRSPCTNLQICSAGRKAF